MGTLDRGRARASLGISRLPRERSIDIDDGVARIKETFTVAASEQRPPTLLRRKARPDDGNANDEEEEGEEGAAARGVTGGDEHLSLSLSLETASAGECRPNNAPYSCPRPLPPPARRCAFPRNPRRRRRRRRDPRWQEARPPLKAAFFRTAARMRARALRRPRHTFSRRTGGRAVARVVRARAYTTTTTTTTTQRKKRTEESRVMETEREGTALLCSGKSLPPAGSNIQ